MAEHHWRWASSGRHFSRNSVQYGSHGMSSSNGHAGYEERGKRHPQLLTWVASFDPALSSWPHHFPLSSDPHPRTAPHHSRDTGKAQLDSLAQVHMRFQNYKPQCGWCRSLKLKQSRFFLPTKVLIHYCKWNSWSAGYWMVIYLHAQKRVSYGSSQYECAMSLDVLCTLFSQSQKKEPLRTVMVLRKREETVCSLPSTCTQHAVLRGKRVLNLIVALARARKSLQPSAQTPHIEEILVSILYPFAHPPFVPFIVQIRTRSPT